MCMETGMVASPAWQGIDALRAHGAAPGGGPAMGGVPGCPGAAPAAQCANGEGAE